MRANPYGVLKTRVIEALMEADDLVPHYQILCSGGGDLYRVAVNVRARTKPSDLLYLVDSDFRHRILAGLVQLPSGFTRLPQRPGGLALDYVRDNLFEPGEMVPMPHLAPGPDNDLAEKLDACVLRAIDEQDARMYAFGHKWGPLRTSRDAVFEFLPTAGVHNVHMNQGNDPEHAHANGVWQDGALLFWFPREQKWVAIFLAFQSQSWKTHPRTGYALGPPGPPPVV